MITVAIVANFIAHYRIPLLNHFAQIPNVKIRALVSREGDGKSDWGSTMADAKFEWEIFPNLAILFRTKRADQTGLYFSPRLWQHLIQTRYDLVVTLGWTMPNSMMALLIRRFQKLPIALWETSIPHPAGTLKQLAMPAIRGYFGSFDGYLAVSSLCREYLTSCGASSERIALLPQAIDNEYFVTQSDVWRAQRETEKIALGLAGRQVILYVGQFTERKGLLPLLDAFRTLAVQRRDIALLFVGNGPLKNELIQRAHAWGLSDCVRFADAVKNAELPRYYALADVFVLPSFYDTYGVVVNEAMASGLPIVTTFGVGAAKDLVRQGENGFIVPSGDLNALAQALAKVVTDEARRIEMGARSRNIISGWTVQVAAQNFARFLELVVKDFPKQ